MSVLALSSPEDLERAWEQFPVRPAYDYLRRPETGSIMIRARADGNGMRFCLGEATITRCTVKMESGQVGCAYVMGWNHRHAELAAVFDGLLLTEGHHSVIMDRVIGPMESSFQRRKEEVLRKAASTKVEFFTMVRGE
ncbi:MAG: phosphonate C-P lyase system protein PhnG [Deltaproteobacteria bacterium]|nr:phosphonate C-P lyase system protein PhnG [Deltaproteobacteria bacterium]